MSSGLNSTIFRQTTLNQNSKINSSNDNKYRALTAQLIGSTWCLSHTHFGVFFFVGSDLLESKHSNKTQTTMKKMPLWGVNTSYYGFCMNINVDIYNIVHTIRWSGTSTCFKSTLFGTAKAIVFPDAWNIFPCEATWIWDITCAMCVTSPPKAPSLNHTFSLPKSY